MKSYEELLAERDALAAQLVAIQDAALKPCGRTRQQWIDNIKRSVFEITARQHLAEIKAEAGRVGFIEGYEQCHYDIDNDYISRSEPMADQYAAKIRNTGTWLRDENVNGGKRQGGE